MWFFITVLFSLLAGIVVTLLVEWYVIYRRYFADPVGAARPPNPTPKTPDKRFQLPQEIQKLLDSCDKNENDTCLAMNVVFQFLFKELKDTARIRRWFTKKLTVEFEELLQKTTAGKLLEQVTIRELFLGSQFPVFRNVTLKNVQVHDKQDYIEEVDLLVDLEYDGGFRLCVDAEMVFGRSASLSVRVAKLEGQSRLRFTRTPFSHWSFAFYEEPLVEFDVQSHFQGRPLPQVTSLIVNQIRRAIRKKHTLPSYKIRFKPFFPKPEPPGGEQVYLSGNRITEGTFEVTIVDCSRLYNVGLSLDSSVYCTLAVDSVAWVELQFSRNNSYVTRDVDVTRQSGQSIGLTFKQEFILDKYEQCVVVEAVNGCGPAALAGVSRGDILVAVGGTRVTSIGQATKLFKQSSDKFTVRIERKTQIKYSPSQESLASSTKGDEDMQGFDDDMEAGMLKDGGSSQASSKPSSCSGSPAKQVPKGPQQQKTKTGDTLTPSANRFPEGDSVLSSDLEVSGEISLKKTSAVKFTQDPVWKESFTFDVEDHHRYLNLCVWCKNPDKLDKQDKTPKAEKDILLGHVSISLMDIALECSTNSSGQLQQSFQLLPPEPKTTANRTHKLAAHPGFDVNLCYGDVSLSFVYKTELRTNKSNKRSRDSFAKESKPEPDSEDDSSSAVNPVPGNTSDPNSSTEPQHEFILTQFYTNICCNFCGKKIWLKMAFQCRICSLICHKKCLSKCQAGSQCTRNDNSTGQLERASRGPEIITTDAAAVDLEADSRSDVPEPQASSVLESPSSKRRLQALLTNLTSVGQSRGLPRVGSAHNLAPPVHQNLPAQSKSLPPSPQSSPATSRKSSLQGNIFGTGYDSDVEEDIETTIQRLLQCSNDEMVVSAAKEKGRELYANYPLAERKLKLNLMVTKLQSEIDTETENRNSLAKAERSTVEPARKVKIALLIAKADEKIQALAILMLYYCSGLQHCQQMEDSTSTAE